MNSQQFENKVSEIKSKLKGYSKSDNTIITNSFGTMPQWEENFLTEIKAVNFKTGAIIADYPILEVKNSKGVSNHEDYRGDLVEIQNGIQSLMGSSATGSIVYVARNYTAFCQAQKELSSQVESNFQGIINN